MVVNCLSSIGSLPSTFLPVPKNRFQPKKFNVCWVINAKECIAEKITKSVEKNTKIVSDKSTSYADLEKNFEIESKVIPKKDIVKVLP